MATSAKVMDSADESGSIVEALTRQLSRPRPVFQPTSEHPYLTRLHSTFGPLFANLHHLVSGPFKRRAHFALLDEKLFDASALTLGHHSLVGINVGASGCIHWAFHYLLAWPVVLMDVGDAEREVGDLMDEKIAKTLTPNCPERCRVARHLRNVALDFVVMHEQSHVCGGHTEYCLAHKGPHPELSELAFNDSTTSEEEAQTYQAIEWLADRWALQALIAQTIDGHGFMADYDDLPDECRTPAMRLRLSILAMLILCVMLDPKPASNDDYRLRRHPHPLLRLLRIESIGRSTVRHKAPPLESAWEPAYLQAAQDLNRFVKLCGLGVNIVEMIEPYMPSFNTDDIADRAKELEMEFAAKGYEWPLK